VDKFSWEENYSVVIIIHATKFAGGENLEIAVEAAAAGSVK